MKIIDNVKKIRPTSWILIVIICLGIFLRTYNFHDWLYFYPDQARDAAIARDVTNNKADWPLMGPIAASTKFSIGPIYYYFQIITGYVFGIEPEKMAYPDLLFAVASIGLMYLFARKYFSDHTSLAVTGLYAISFYAIRYSRFAWNTNPIPFFVLLFLYSLHEFLIAEKNPRWHWAILLGISVGVGIQLHTTLMIILPACLFFASVYILRKNPSSWKRWLVVVLIIVSLNVPQMISEWKEGFYNTRMFFRILDDRAPEESSGMVKNFALDTLCHIQANIEFVTPLLTNNTCDTFVDIITIDSNSDAWEDIGNHNVFLLIIIGGAIFTAFGYAMTAYFWISEKEKNKKIFLFMLIVFSVVNFIVLFPIISHNGQVRYFLPVIFIPYIFFGLIFESLLRKKQKISTWSAGLIIILIVASNIAGLYEEAVRHKKGTRSDATYVVLGEIEPAADYLISKSRPHTEAYLFGDYKYMQNYYKPLSYLADPSNLTFLRTRHPEKALIEGLPAFYIGKGRRDDLGLDIDDYKILDTRKFGNMVIFQIAKED